MYEFYLYLSVCAERARAATEKYSKIMKETCAAAAASAAEDDGKVVLDGNARLQRSINGDVYYVSCSSLSCSAESNDGRRIVFRKCGGTKAKRTVVVIAFLTLLDLAISIAVVVRDF